jgi:hypothetical protein
MYVDAAFSALVGYLGCLENKFKSEENTSYYRKCAMIFNLQACSSGCPIGH